MLNATTEQKYHRAEEDHWRKAILSLNNDDTQHLDVSNPNKLAVLTQTLEAVERKKRLCLEKRWKYTNHGKEIIIRDQLEKVVVWVEKFKAVGNTAIQYDAGHAALPWAGVLLVLQIAVNDSETLRAMIEGIEQISHLLTRCAILESLYKLYVFDFAIFFQSQTVFWNEALLIGYYFLF